jgi:hypothetical protein
MVNPTAVWPIPVLGLSVYYAPREMGRRLERLGISCVSRTPAGSYVIPGWVGQLISIVDDAILDDVLRRVVTDDTFCDALSALIFVDKLAVQTFLEQQGFAV